MASHSSYHQWECGAIGLMSAVGVAHLGLRIILTTGLPGKVLGRSQAASHMKHSSFGNLEDSYSTVYSLLPHVEDMPLEDLFQYTAVSKNFTRLLLLHVRKCSNV